MTEKKKQKKGTADDFTQEAYLGIRKMFFVNDIGPGQKISYGDLAKRLGMSTTPVIQALKRLEDQGLVRHEPNRGYYTEDISLKEIIEIYEFRELIETSLLPKSMAKLNQRKLGRLKKSLDNHLAAVQNVFLQDRLKKDMEFHLTLASFSESTIQINTLRTLFDLLYLKYRGNALFVSPMHQVEDAHVRLYDCVEAGDVDGAVEMLRDHIIRVREFAVASIQQLEKVKVD